MPSTAISPAQLENGAIGLLALLVACGLAGSKGEGRRLVEQGGILLNDVKVSDIAAVVSAASLKDGLIIRKGKKVHHRATMN
jgi:tyrosyl-tRNA synthetase